MTAGDIPIWNILAVEIRCLFDIRPYIIIVNPVPYSHLCAINVLQTEIKTVLIMLRLCLHLTLHLVDLKIVNFMLIVNYLSTFIKWECTCLNIIYIHWADFVLQKIYVPHYCLWHISIYTTNTMWSHDFWLFENVVWAIIRFQKSFFFWTDFVLVMFTTEMDVNTRCNQGHCCILGC